MRLATFVLCASLLLAGTAVADTRAATGFGRTSGHFNGTNITGISGVLRSTNKTCLHHRAITILKAPAKTGPYRKFGDGTSDRQGTFGIDGHAPTSDVFQITVAKAARTTVTCGAHTIYVRFQSPVG
jgi:hypothetical protein